MMPFVDRVWHELKTQPSRWLLLLVLFFLFFPGVDIWISAQYYQPGVGFAWERDGFLEFVRAAGDKIIVGTFVFCVILWVAGIWYEQWFWGMTTHRATFLITSIIVGPGLIVNALLKPNWGRARPKDITDFGGQAHYTPPLFVANECAGSNCSFASGHAAVAFWVTAYGFMLPAKWRALGVAAGIVIGIVVGWVRIAQGAHFFSDIVFAGLIVVGVNFALYRQIILREAAPEHLP
jgi:lipid A 4'-phosphatase